MDYKKILNEIGITEEQISTIEKKINAELHKEYIPKEQYNKKVVEINNIKEDMTKANEKINELEANTTNSESFKKQYEDIVAEYKTFRSDVEKKEANIQKTQTLQSELKALGFNSKIANLLEKQINIETLEIEEGKIKGWEETAANLKEEYKDYIQVEHNEVFSPSNPPVAGGEINPLAAALERLI